MVSSILKADVKIPIFYHDTNDFLAFEVYGKGITGLFARLFLLGFEILPGLFLFGLQVYYYFQLIYYFNLDNQLYIYIGIIIVSIVLSAYIANFVTEPIYHIVEYRLFLLLYHLQLPHMVDIFLQNGQEDLILDNRLRIHHFDKISNVHSKEVIKGSGKESTLNHKNIKFRSNGYPIVLGKINFSPDSTIDKTIVQILTRQDKKIKVDYNMRYFKTPDLSELIDKGKKRGFLSSLIYKTETHGYNQLANVIEAIILLFNISLFLVIIFLFYYVTYIFSQTSLLYQVLLLPFVFTLWSIMLGIIRRITISDDRSPTYYDGDITY